MLRDGRALKRMATAEDMARLVDWQCSIGKETRVKQRLSFTTATQLESSGIFELNKRDEKGPTTVRLPTRADKRPPQRLNNSV